VLDDGIGSRDDAAFFSQQARPVPRRMSVGERGGPTLAFDNPRLPQRQLEERCRLLQHPVFAFVPSEVGPNFGQACPPPEKNIIDVACHLLPPLPYPDGPDPPRVAPPHQEAEHHRGGRVLVVPRHLVHDLVPFDDLRPPPPRGGRYDEMFMRVQEVLNRVQRRARPAQRFHHLTPVERVAGMHALDILEEEGNDVVGGAATNGVEEGRRPPPVLGNQVPGIPPDHRAVHVEILDGRAGQDVEGCHPQAVPPPPAAAAGRIWLLHSAARRRHPVVLSMSTTVGSIDRRGRLEETLHGHGIVRHVVHHPVHRQPVESSPERVDDLRLRFEQILQIRAIPERGVLDDRISRQRDVPERAASPERAPFDDTRCLGHLEGEHGFALAEHPRRDGRQQGRRAEAGEDAARECLVADALDSVGYRERYGPRAHERQRPDIPHGIGDVHHPEEAAVKECVSLYRPQVLAELHLGEGRAGRERVLPDGTYGRRDLDRPERRASAERPGSDLEQTLAQLDLLELLAGEEGRRGYRRDRGIDADPDDVLGNFSPPLSRVHVHRGDGAAAVVLGGGGREIRLIGHRTQQLNA